MKRKHAPTRRPHKLDLYRRAVQHPLAEAAFLHRAYRHYFKSPPMLLREDFAGTCAIASAWVMMDPDHQAMAVESHRPTAAWAQRTAKRELGLLSDDLHIVEADVMDIHSPRVDITCALNFSTYIYHDRAALKHYFQSARRGLKRDGLLVVDAYGGPGAMRIGTQSRTVPSDGEGHAGFTYHWEQRSFDPVSHRTECRVHFDFHAGQHMNSAFVYRWRLWTLPELTKIMLESGFKIAEVWCDRMDPDSVSSDGRYRPIRKMPARDDWVAYVVGTR